MLCFLPESVSRKRIHFSKASGNLKKKAKLFCCIFIYHCFWSIDGLINRLCRVIIHKFISWLNQTVKCSHDFEFSNQFLGIFGVLLNSYHWIAWFNLSCRSYFSKVKIQRVQVRAKELRLKGYSWALTSSNLCISFPRCLLLLGKMLLTPSSGQNVVLLFFNSKKYYNKRLCFYYCSETWKNIQRYKYFYSEESFTKFCIGYVLLQDLKNSLTCSVYSYVFKSEEKLSQNHYN